MPLADTHREIGAICGDSVGIGVSFDFIRKVIEGAIDAVGKHGSAFYIPVPTTLSGDAELRIYLHAISRVPLVDFDAQDKLVDISRAEFQIDFSVHENQTIETLHRYNLTLNSTRAAPRVRHTGAGLQFFLEPQGRADMTHGSPIYTNPDFEDILRRLKISPREYELTERVQLVLSLGAISEFLFSLFTIDQFDSITSICKVQPPVSIGFTSEYLVLYSRVYSLEKPPCGCAAQVARPKAMEKASFSISPILVYLSTEPLKEYANRHVLPSMKSMQSSSILDFVEFSLELHVYRDEIRISSRNEANAGSNAARLEVATDLHASANLDARLRLGPCDIARADLASVTADLTGSTASITVQAPPNSFTAVGTVDINVGNIDFNFGAAAYPLNLISSRLEKIAEDKVREQFSGPMGEVFRVEFLELADIFNLAGIPAFGVLLESDGEGYGGRSVLYGVMPRQG